MYETVKVIRLSDMDEVKDFVRAAGGCDFDIDVKCDRTFIDAKSLLGMIGLGVKKNLQVCYGGKNENFSHCFSIYSGFLQLRGCKNFEFRVPKPDATVGNAPSGCDSNFPVLPCTGIADL